MQNLTTEEQTEWARKCGKAREIARQAPCYHPGQALMECYSFNIGPWNCRLTVDRFATPSSWHGTVSLFKEIGTEPVMDEQGRRLFEIPQDALLAVRSWNNEEKDIAKDVLGAMFGPLIHGERQRVVVSEGVFALHWQTAEREAGTLDS